MVSKQEIRNQLKRIHFNHKGWGKGEITELHNIILPGEEIYEAVNGMYEGGFALLLASDIRVLLVDKKPLNYLTVEDMRFDMISEMDYNHRLFGAEISISAGDKNLRFRSYNQARLRKLIGHVQHCMAESKKKESNHQEGQVQHLEQINRQLQAYLVAQHNYQLQIQHMQLTKQNSDNASSNVPAPPKPEGQLADFLYAQSLMSQHEQQLGDNKTEATPKGDTEKSKPQAVVENAQPMEPSARPDILERDAQLDEIYADGLKEVFGKQPVSSQLTQASDTDGQSQGGSTHRQITDLAQKINLHMPFEINPLHIAYSKLPMALRNRKFGSGASNSNIRRHKAANPSRA
jgi:hypothetical protein